MIEDWLRWPTRSPDPALNAAIAVLLAVTAIVLVAFGAVFLLPVVLLIGLAKGVHWYKTRPIPTDQLYTTAQQRAVTANFPDPEKFLEAWFARFHDAMARDAPICAVFVRMMEIANELYRAERLGNPLPPLAQSSQIEDGRYRDEIIAHQRKTLDAPRTLETFSATLCASFLDVIAALPAVAKGDRATFADDVDAQPFATFPLIDVLPDPADQIMRLVVPLFRQDVLDLGLFTNLRADLDRNFARAFGDGANPKPVPPERFKGTPRDMAMTYLGGTPLETLFATPIPFAFADQQRFEHMHIIGGSGHGKTQLLQRLIYDDLQRPDPPALIVIDSQGEMLDKIQKLGLFGQDPDRLVVIDPEKYSPALNMFDTANARAASYTGFHREQLQAGVIELYNYIFASIAAEMTSRQSTAFAFVAALMLAIPGATIHTLRELMEDPAPSIGLSPFRHHIEKLDPTARSYFENQFFTKRYADLKQQIARRLYGVLSVPAFDRMFSAKENKLDMFEAMRTGKVVLVNTSKALLKSDASALFGRFMIALVIRAVYERAAASDRRPAFLIVDEASEYFDDNIQLLLEQARKFNVGLVLAHQHLDQLSASLRSAIAANTAIKLAGGINDRDARALAPDMRTSADFIASMQKRAHSTEFACYVRNKTQNALRLEIPFGTVESAPRMSPEVHRALIGLNHIRYGVSPAAPRTTEAGPEESRPAAADHADKPDEDWRS